MKQSETVVEMKQRLPQTALITDGLYALHYLRWLQYFDETQMMVIDSSEIIRNPGKVVEKLQDFMKIQKLLFQDDFVKKVGDTMSFCFHDWETNNDNCHVLEEQAVHTDMTSNTMSKLRLFYKSYNDAFFDLIERRFRWH